MHGIIKLNFATTVVTLVVKRKKVSNFARHTILLNLKFIYIPSKEKEKIGLS